MTVISNSNHSRLINFRNIKLFETVCLTDTPHQAFGSSVDRWYGEIYEPRSYDGTINLVREQNSSENSIFNAMYQNVAPARVNIVLKSASCISSDHALSLNPDRCLVLDADIGAALDDSLSHSRLDNKNAVNPVYIQATNRLQTTADTSAKGGSATRNNAKQRWLGLKLCDEPADDADGEGMEDEGRAAGGKRPSVLTIDRAAFLLLRVKRAFKKKRQQRKEKK
ncbi:hypothetical protein EVAR_11337_1 [Eumeta japonica]|uniref:Uncharacterized protein n=1 Tax=Eumeta variegata TaxID=151549 RepID=A0A4C1U182_EUMVA|nr:hypothetical protein EVAR_11337_1 [Eumeta japonica]